MTPRDSINTILFDSPEMPQHTDMGRVFEAFGGLQRRYNWLMSGDEQFFVRGKPMWMSGDELTERVEDGWSLFSWGVFSGFEPHEAVDLNGNRFPYADGNPGFWAPYPRPQHPQARVEIVCFEDSFTMLLSREAEFAERFRAYFTNALDLDDYILRHVVPVVEAWADAERRFPVGTVLTVPVAGVGQTTALVELAPDFYGTLRVKQMREMGFGRRHWFALSDELKAGQRVTVRISAFDAKAQAIEVDMLGLET